MELTQALIVYKAGDAFSQRWAETLGKALEALGCRILVGPSGPQDNPYPVFMASVSRPIDVAFVLGGDGTALAAARHLAPEKIPMLAVNVGGHLGFLTEPFELFQDIPTLLQRLQTDQYAMQQRMMLQAQAYEGPRPQSEPVGERYLALNEMCIKPASADRMITAILEMEIDGDVVDQYQGDGMLVATPTGSTCYNVAANGPIIHPGMEAIAVSPICPLSLSSRPVILPARSIVSIWPLEDRSLATKLWMDGVLATSIWPGQRVDVSMADCEARFIILTDHYSFYQTLREKLHWAGARIRYNNSYVQRNGKS